MQSYACARSQATASRRKADTIHAHVFLICIALPREWVSKPPDGDLDGAAHASGLCLVMLPLLGTFPLWQPLQKDYSPWVSLGGVTGPVIWPLPLGAPLGCSLCIPSRGISLRGLFSVVIPWCALVRLCPVCYYRRRDY